MLDPSSDTWKHVEAWATARLARYQAQHENISVEDRAALILRSRIAEMRALLALSKAPAERPVESTDPAGY